MAWGRGLNPNAAPSCEESASHPSWDLGLKSWHIYRKPSNTLILLLGLPLFLLLTMLVQATLSHLLMVGLLRCSDRQPLACQGLWEASWEVLHRHGEELPDPMLPSVTTTNRTKLAPESFYTEEAPFLGSGA